MAHILTACMKHLFGDKEQSNAAKPEPIVTTAKRNRGLTRVLQPAHTIRLRPEREAGSSLRFRSSGISDCGLVREHNEDAYALHTFTDMSLYVVADGMGGHDRGEVASRIAVESVSAVVREERSRFSDPLQLVEQAVQRANADVLREGERTGSDMGTTLCVALVSGDTAYVANVGDSRAYWLENGSASLVTMDHSLVAKLAAMGRLTQDEARNHPRANLLYRTIGADETVPVDTFRVALKRGGTLLLCTDGLWGEVADDEMGRVCAAERNTERVAARLVELANGQGGKDNITAVVVGVA